MPSAEEEAEDSVENEETALAREIRVDCIIEEESLRYVGGYIVKKFCQIS